LASFFIMLSHTQLSKLTLIFLIALASVVEKVQVTVAQSDAGVPATATASGTTVQIDSADSANSINQVLKQAFEKQSAGKEIKLSSGSTDAVIQSVLDGKYDLAAIGRPLTADETAQGLAATSLKRHKIAVVVGADNPFQGSLTIDQFAKIFRGEITDWSDVGGQPGPIRLIDRPDTNDTRQAFPNYTVFQSGPLETGANATKLAEDDVQAVAKALGNDGISYMIANQVPTQSGVRAIQMHKTLPDDPRYPFSQPLAYVYKGSTPSPVVKEFLNFVDSPAGQSAIASASGPTSELAASTGAVNDANPSVGGIASDPGTIASRTSTTGAPQAESGGVPPWLWGLPVLALAGGAVIWGMNRNRSSTDTASGGVVPSTPPSPISPLGQAPLSSTGKPIAGGRSSIGSKLGDVADSASNVAEGAAQAGNAAILGGAALAAGAGAAAFSMFSDREPSDENLSTPEMNGPDAETPSVNVRSAEMDSPVVGGVLNPWDMSDSAASGSAQFVQDAGLTEIQILKPSVADVEPAPNLTVPLTTTEDVEPAPNLTVPLTTTEIDPEALLPDDDGIDLFAGVVPTVPEAPELVTDSFDLGAVDPYESILPDDPEVLADPFDLTSPQPEDLVPPVSLDLTLDEFDRNVASADDLMTVDPPELAAHPFNLEDAATEPFETLDSSELTPDPFGLDVAASSDSVSPASLEIVTDSQDLGAIPTDDWAAPEDSDAGWETAALASSAAVVAGAGAIASTPNIGETAAEPPTLEPLDFDPFNAAATSDVEDRGMPDLSMDVTEPITDTLTVPDPELTAPTDLADTDLADMDLSDPFPSVIRSKDSAEGSEELIPSLDADLSSFEPSDAFSEFATPASNEILEVGSDDLFTDPSYGTVAPASDEFDEWDSLLSEQAVDASMGDRAVEMDRVDLPLLELTSEDELERPAMDLERPFTSNELEALPDLFPSDTPSVPVESLADAQPGDPSPTSADNDWDALLLDLQSNEPTAELPDVDLFSSLETGSEANLSAELPTLDELANLSPELPDLDLEASLEDLLGPTPPDSNEADKSDFFLT
jgi:ABC-type phosphate transport system substrate-binding protein